MNIIDQTLEKAIELLSAAWLDPKQRDLKVTSFQNLVWDTPQEGEESPEWEVFGDLAFDLAYYQPKRRIRKQDPLVYGPAELENELARGLHKLHKLGCPLPLEIVARLDNA